MHKKLRIHGHMVHRLPKCPGLYYTVEPEHSCIAVYMLKYDELNDGLCYNEFEDISIHINQLGRHGYLQKQIELIAKRHSDLALTPIRNDLERNKMLYNTFAGCLSNMSKDLKALNDTIFEEEKKMTEYYVIDVEMTHADYKTKATECLQIRQLVNYFEIPFDGPDCSEYRLNRLYERLYDHVTYDTHEMFRIALRKSETCSNSVLEITIPYGNNISDGEYRRELCKMLTYAVEHGEYPYPIGNAGLTKICFFLRECDNRKIYEKVYSEGIDCTITIEGTVFRDGFYFDYIPEPRDIIKLRFMDGRLTHFTLADDPKRELIAASGNTPGALYHIYKHDKPFQHVDEVKSLLRDIFGKRLMWSNASYMTYNTFSARNNSTNREKI